MLVVQFTVTMVNTTYLSRTVQLIFFQFGADVLGAMSVELGFDVMLCDSYDDMLSDLLEVEGADFDQWELGFSGMIDGQQYDFVVDCAD